jgi:DNA-binding MarR family transcriptional regulator
MAEEDLNGLVETVERLLPQIMRRVFLAPGADSPLWDAPLPQLRLLGMLERRGEARMSEVSEKLGVALSTATQIADRLTARGWTRRESDPDDRRVVRLVLTEEGRRLAGERRAERHERLGQILGALTPAAREQVISGLETLCRAARALDPLDPAAPAPTPAGGALWELLAGRADAREDE